MRFFLNNVELLSSAIGAAVILGGVFLVHVPVWIAITVGVAVAAGLWLVGSSWLDMSIRQEATGLTPEHMLRRIRSSRQILTAIRGAAGNIPDHDVQERLQRVCDLSERIFGNFEEDPEDIPKASRFLLYLDRFLPLIEKYARLSSTDEGRALLEKSGDNEEFSELLVTVEQGFAKGFQNYLENDVVELRTFGRVLKKMIDVAEIGK